MTTVFERKGAAELSIAMLKNVGGIGLPGHRPQGRRRACLTIVEVSQGGSASKLSGDGGREREAHMARLTLWSSSMQPCDVN